MPKILGTDSDLLGRIPESTDREQRATEAAQIAATLESLSPQDPALRALLSRFQEQLHFVGSPAAEVDSEGDVQAPGDSASETAPELSPEQLKTLAALKQNHESKEAQLKTGLKWNEVEAKLRKSPEKLDVLARLIARGGEPTASARLSNGNFRFDELSADSPTGNRGVNFDQAETLATQLGAELMEPAVYESFRGRIALDKSTWSWLRTTKQVRETGGAFNGRNGVYYRSNAGDRLQKLGLRCSVEV